jgi:large subunit ribosomal protein LP2
LGRRDAAATAVLPSFRPAVLPRSSPRSSPRSYSCLARFNAPAVGVDADADGAALLIKELEGKDVEEVITAGREKLQSVGGGVAVAGGAAGASAGGAAAPAAEEKVEEEEDEDMGFSLFD